MKNETNVECIEDIRLTENRIDDLSSSRGQVDQFLIHDIR